MCIEKKQWTNKAAKKGLKSSTKAHNNIVQQTNWRVNCWLQVKEPSQRNALVCEITINVWNKRILHWINISKGTRRRKTLKAIPTNIHMCQDMLANKEDMDMCEFLFFFCLSAHLRRACGFSCQPSEEFYAKPQINTTMGIWGFRKWLYASGCVLMPKK